MKAGPGLDHGGIPEHIHVRDHKQFGTHGVKFIPVMPIKLAIMSKETHSKAGSKTLVMGHDIARVRPTALGIFWIFVYLVFPILFLGNLIDLMFQYLFGWCIGVWCVFPS